MKKTVSHIKKWWVIYTASTFFILFFYKVFFQQLYPFPGDLLVSWFFPYKNGGWEGYSPWITHKEFIAADVVRQLYPWRELALEMIKNFQPPLWNPYAFSGTPLLANLQSATLYPLNILFFLIPSKYAWNVYILAQPIIAFITMYLFSRSLKLSKHASFFAGVAFSCIGYFIIWFEHGVVMHSGVWLPLILWGVHKSVEKGKNKYLIVSAIAIALSILAGHAQTALYALLLSGAFYIYKTWGTPLKSVIKGALLLLSGVALSAVQIIPSIELMLNAARTTQASQFLQDQFQMPVQQMITLFAPDIFGNPATLNYWGEDYGEFVTAVGVTTLILALVGIASKFRYKKFIIGVSVISLSVALIPQIFDLFSYLNIPILGTGIPARVLFLFQFSIVIFAAFGTEAFLKSKIRKKILVLPLAIYAGLWLITFFNIQLFDQMPENAASIARRNLVLPTATAVFVCGVLSFTNKKKLLATLSIFILSATLLFETAYTTYKYLPFSEINFMFPQHPFVERLQEVNPERVYGYNTAKIDSNLFVQWRVLSPEGYDPLYVKRYGELLAAAEGKQELRRSDAVLTDSQPNDDTVEKRRLINILGVKYVLDKDDAAPQDWQQNAEMFPEDRYKLVFQDFKWKMYENREVLPRAAVFYDYSVLKDDEKVLTELFSEDFPYTSKIILEEEVSQAPATQESTPALITKYTPNTVDIEINPSQSGILYLSDTYYPGWSVYVDGVRKDIIRANYAFRGVAVNKDSQRVVFVYEPLSFYLGAAVTIFTILALTYVYKKNL